MSDEEIREEDTEDTQDGDPANMMLRAGYLMGLSLRLHDGDDRRMLQRASRSLVFAAEHMVPGK